MNRKELLTAVVVMFALAPDHAQADAGSAQGAGKLAANSDVPPDELRRRVTSPGGTTEQALLSFNRDNFTDIVEAAMQAAKQRAAELAGNS